MNRSFRAAESQMQAPVQQQRQGRSLGAVMKDKEEDLALFLEMRKRDKERNSLLLLHTSEDFDPPLGFLRHLVLLFFLLWKWSQTNPPWVRFQPPKLIQLHRSLG